MKDAVTSFPTDLPEGRSDTGGGGKVSPCTVCMVRDRAFCGALGDDALEKLEAISTGVTVRAPRTFLYEGDHADDTFNVCTGVVRLTKMLPDGRRQITGFLFPGDFIGLASRTTYAYSAEAVTDVHLCRFPRARLLTLFETMPELEHRLLAMAADELASAQDQLLLLGRKTARERVASFLFLMSRQSERRGDDATMVDLPMSRADIADFLGLTIETVSRTITRLAREGVISLPNAHKAVLNDLDALERIQTGLDVEV